MFLFTCHNRCLWEEVNLEEDMFLQMVELLHHLGLACRLPSEDPEELNLLVPWFLSEYPDAVQGFSESLSENQVCVLNIWLCSKVFLPTCTSIVNKCSDSRMWGHWQNVLPDKLQMCSVSYQPLAGPEACLIKWDSCTVEVDMFIIVLHLSKELFEKWTQSFWNHWSSRLVM